MLSVTVAIPTLNRAAILASTLDSLLAADLDHVCEILILDQSSVTTDETQRTLSRYSRSELIQWHHLSHPSLPAARNAALAKASGDIVLFLDDDVLIPFQLVSCHLAQYGMNLPGDKQIVAVTGQVFHRNASAATSDITLANFQRFAHPHFLHRPGDRPWRWVLGGNHSVLRSAAIAVGGYDENFRGAANYEDTDFAHRLARAGYGKIVLCEDAWLVHLRYSTGGCRIPGNSTWSEADKVMGQLLYTQRYVHGAAYWKNLAAAIRSGPLRRENVLHPRRQLMAWKGFAHAFKQAYAVRSKVNSPFSPAQLRV